MKLRIKAGLFLLLLFALPVAAADVEIICRKSFYTPDKITVKKGEKVRIVLRAVDVPHGFAIDELDIATEVSPGLPKILEFTPERAGTFEFYCVVRCGKDHVKMRGTLTVQD